MKDLDFNVVKSEEQFQRNYKLHDIAEVNGDQLLEKMDFGVEEYGEDKRYKKVWEKGEDKPDRIIKLDDKPVALLDWKGKSGEYWMMNKRAYDAYIEWKEEHDLPVFVAMARIQDKKIEEFRYISLPVKDECIKKIYEEWDKNEVIKFYKDCMKDLGKFEDEF